MSIDEHNKESKCKGLFYRYTANHFVGGTGKYVFSHIFRPLKRISCKGCPECEWLEEHLAESVNLIGVDDERYVPTKAINGKIYRLKVIHFDAICEDVEIGFVEVKQKEK